MNYLSCLGPLYCKPTYGGSLWLLLCVVLSGCGGGGGSTGGGSGFTAPVGNAVVSSASLVAQVSATSSSSRLAASSLSSFTSSAKSSSASSDNKSVASSSRSSTNSLGIITSSSVVSLSSSSLFASSSQSSASSVSSNSISSSLGSSKSSSSQSSSASSVASISSASSSSSSSLTSKIVLPIEVLGPPGTTKGADFQLTGNLGTATHLWLNTHRLTWREDGEFAMKFNGSVRPGSKGSVRLNNGPWLGLSNLTVTCEKHEAAYGCLNGTYQSVKLKVPLSALGSPGLKTGVNRIDFRFDATDGISSGWRVLGFTIKGTAGDQISTSTFIDDDPDTWAAPQPAAADVAAGKQLWESANLMDLGFSNSQHAINGKCKSCHVRDGFDLAYFNYSNLSIIERSKFHGLTQDQGEKIASYIRSLNMGIPNGYSKKDAGRPWNPPYQPGPGLDSRPVELWAAGASLNAVLDSDSDMKAFMFSGGNYDAAVLGATGHLNPRETPQALQFVDWNAWLPTIALEDLVSDPSKLAPFAGTTPPADNLQNPLDMLKAANLWLENYRFNQMETDDWYLRWGQFLMLRWGSSRWPNSNPGIPGVQYPTDAVGHSRTALAIDSWYAIRLWEMLKKYKLEDLTARSGVNIKLDNSGVRGIPTGYRSWSMPFRTVFENAPHFVGPNTSVDPSYGSNFVFSKPGEYLTTAWYSIEQVVNGGWRSGSQGIDWNYHPAHIGGMHRGGTNYYTDGPMHLYRWSWSVFWLYQSRPQDWTPSYLGEATSGFMQRQIGFGLDVPFMSDAEAAGQISVAERKQLQEALALAFLGVAERYRPDQWMRRSVDSNRSSSTFESVDYVAHYNPLWSYDLCEQGYQADCYYLRIKTLKENNFVTPGTLDRLVNWGKGVWPKGEWELLRP